MIQISRSVTNASLENLYNQIPINGTVDLQIPITIESSEFGIVSAVIQFVSTWIRSTKAGLLKIHFSEFERQAEDFVKQDFAYPSIVMAWSRGIVDANTGNDIRNQLREYNQVINMRMRSLKDIRGNQLLLTCFDHLPTKNGLLGCFYDGTSYISSEDILEFTLIPTLVHQLKFNRELLKSNFRKQLDDLRGMIFELMKNTHEWARSNKNNIPFNPNVRGLYARFVRKPKASFVEAYEDNPGLRQYFETLNPTLDGFLYFVELTIFDSGAGFIDKYAEFNERRSMQDKIDILKKCLAKNNTAARGIAATGKGLGLDRILRILNDKGLLLIRTDSIFVYRNLKQVPHSESQDPLDIDLFDWRLFSNGNFTEFSKVSGSRLTIVYPLT